MDTKVMNRTLKEKLIQLFEEHQETIFKNDAPEMIQKRKQSFEAFKAAGFPTTRLEKWRNTDLSKVLEADYSYYFEPTFKKVSS